MARVYLSPPDVGELEREALLRAFDSGWIAPVGPELDGFERDIAELTGWPGAVALSSGTAALHLALLVSGVQPGDDVFVSTFTFAATANAVVYCGANPVFIDSETTSWSMSPELLAEALDDAKRRNKLPAAVVVVDLYGQCADYGAIAPMCRELGIPIIEDAAEALGATHLGRPAGTLGDIGLYSFNGNKIVTTSGGGMLITPDEDVAERVRYLSTQARLPAVHYEHEEVGYNYRLSNLLAALGRAQLSRLHEFVDRRLEVNAQVPRTARRRRRARVHADRPVERLERLAHLCRLRRRPRPRPGHEVARRSRHRSPPSLEADARPARLRSTSDVDQRRQRSPVRPRIVPAERVCARPEHDCEGRGRRQR